MLEFSQIPTRCENQCKQLDCKCENVICVNKNSLFYSFIYQTYDSFSKLSNNRRFSHLRYLKISQTRESYVLLLIICLLMMLMGISNNIDSSSEFANIRINANICKFLVDLSFDITCDSYVRIKRDFVDFISRDYLTIENRQLGNKEYN